ncbi:hypothetical protein NQ317_015849 [Molorchus minor]|uniref:Aprataxin and PNK-like factor n=1 Tax=Molorchus minor TaxID=1323400 RepID=A0ABQ9ISU1_9CUCU|nr:hypothetical protein NQ317_015849 [Molorchus minor]
MTLVKIYNLDSPNNVVSTFPEGKHVIGRGAILNCHDKRVSRKHALITIENDVVMIKAVHVNPCFYKSVSENSIKILSKDSSTVLSDGDQFALLADSFWFQVKIKENNDGGNSYLNGNLPLEQNEEVLTDRGDQQEDTNAVNSTPSSSKRCADEEGPGIDPIQIVSKNVAEDEHLDEQLCETIDPNKLIDSLKSIVEQDYGVENEEQGMVSHEYSSDKSNDANKGEMVSEGVFDEEVGKLPTPSEETVASGSVDKAVKVKEEPSEAVQLNRNLSDSQNEDGQGEASNSNVLPADKIKKEKDIVKTEDVSTDDDVSKDNQNGPSCSTDDKDKKKSRRERCWYGPNCYRKNPLHQEDFSHPGDDDYDDDPDDDRPDCPFWGTLEAVTNCPKCPTTAGSSCTYTNSAEKNRIKQVQLDKRKPKAVKRVKKRNDADDDSDEKPRRKRKTPKKPKADDSSQDHDSDDDGGDGNTGTPRRKRRAATKKQTADESLEEDYDYDDPFINDATSDEFELSSDEDDEDTEWEDSQMTDEESQETRRLLKEARKFTRGKRKKNN